MSAPRQLADHFFRHEYGRLVSTLSRRVGAEHIETVEDAVQSALMSALESWTLAGVPENPSAWLFRAAKNKLLDELRAGFRHRRILEQQTEALTQAETLEAFAGEEMPDDLLRMLFVCCDEGIPPESQLVFALKVLCGFDVREIALRLFTSEANVYKRLSRARVRLQSLVRPHEDLTSAEYSSRLPSVRRILYLMFTEGYLSSHAETAIRRELCAEAIRLTTLLAQHTVGESPQTSALLALMYLHSARLASRQDEMGGLLLLAEQDRGSWDQDDIASGLSWLAKSAAGDDFSRYHAEAAIAAEHCLAPSLRETNWGKVAECYALLERIAPSPLHRLNRALVVAEQHGPAAGLALLDGFQPPTWLAESWIWAAVLADLHGRCGNTEIASRCRELACQLAPTAAIKQLLTRRLRSA